MEEPSFISGATTNRTGEISDSNSISSLRYPNPNGGGGPSPSKFKGVVVQPNGHWGAQIYAKHQRSWLGTFKSEKEAAMAYDSMAMKIRNGSMHRNFPRTETTEFELGFQNNFSVETILSMIKDGSYFSEFSDYVRAQEKQAYHSSNNNNNCLAAFHDYIPEVGLRQLFQKELTPSDVSKLNRLVIPKKYALKYFPCIPDLNGQGDNFGGSNNGVDTELVFFDRWMRSWKLRYCYWRSSQSFVFTKGWNRFAKKKRLRPRDKVIFSSYESGGQRLTIIDVAYYDDHGTRVGGVVGGRDSRDEALEMKMGLPGFDGSVDGGGNGNVGVAEGKENEVPSLGLPEKKGFRLFGFQIA